MTDTTRINADATDATECAARAVYVELDPAELVLADNVRDRVDLSTDPAFVASVREHGVLAAITATYDADGKVVVEDGQRRVFPRKWPCCVDGSFARDRSRTVFRVPGLHPFPFSSVCSGNHPPDQGGTMTTPNEFENPATDRTDATPQAAATTCCSTERQTTCCDQSEKSTCCGPAATAGGGCGCQ